MTMTQIGQRRVINKMYNIAHKTPFSISKKASVFLPNQAQALPPKAKLQIIKNKLKPFTFQR